MLFTRVLWPLDETRYAAVAWEMWLRGDFLVPHLNGQPYSDKPPLLFWLINAGWWVFGINDWWPRIVAPLFALGNLFLTARLARLLWPGHETLARHAPLVALGCLVWAFFTTLTMFDMLLVFFVLLGLLGLVYSWRHGGIGGWILLSLALGLGILSKGPVILVHVLPVALLAPFWAVENRPTSWPRWYACVLAATIMGALIGLAWAIPAAAAGGVEYGEAILWGQVTHRIVTDAAHPQPGWWYLVLLPALLFPWSVWPPLWRSLRRLRTDSRQGNGRSGLRFCLLWLLPAFAICSLINGKQVHWRSTRKRSVVRRPPRIAVGRPVLSESER